MSTSSAAADVAPDRFAGAATANTDHAIIGDGKEESEEVSSPAGRQRQRLLFRKLVDGPPMQLGTGKVAHQTHASVVGTSGSTVLLTTVAKATTERMMDGGTFLTVDYRQRYHGVGKIPGVRSRSDNRVLGGPEEVLASRAIDRALRPMLIKATQPEEGGEDHPVHLHVQCSVESYHDSPSDDVLNPPPSSSGHPVALAINSASAALLRGNHLSEPVAATVLSIMPNGTIIQDPSARGSGQEGGEESLGELLYAGTRDCCVMLEWSSSSSSSSSAGTQKDNDLHDYAAGLPEEAWSDLLNVAHGCIQPLLDTIHEMQGTTFHQSPSSSASKLSSSSTADAAESAARIRMELERERIVQEEEDRAILGLPPAPSLDDGLVAVDRQQQQQHPPPLLLDEVTRYCQSHLGDSMRRFFGHNPSHDGGTSSGPRRDNLHDINHHDVTVAAFLHDGASIPLISKSTRGRREGLIRQEIDRLVCDFLDKNSPREHNNSLDEIKESKLDTASVTNDRSTTGAADATTGTDDNTNINIKWVQERVSDRLFRRALWQTTCEYGTRADGRLPGHRKQQQEGWRTVRPINLQVPTLPDEAVHGSALFARGETQVLCTVTLGPPRDGMPHSDHYRSISPSRGATNNYTNNGRTVSNGEWNNNDKNNVNGNDKSKTPYDSLPVGSLRYLRNQEAMLADLNSRHVRVERERTGDSGSLAEYKRAFVQYDFPAYSTGSVPGGGGRGGGAAHKRRSIGHGALAERAILPVLPSAHEFPYAVRITSEVTDSNGSSSMASVCGATLALLDCGVPLRHAVAGVSVGVVVEPEYEYQDQDDSGDNEGAEKESTESFGVLLDITGTEDHYGACDFKIAGTLHGVTAVQLDVKRPLPLHVLVDALYLAKSGRRVILEEMDRQASSSPSSALGRGLRPRAQLKDSAPRVEVVRFDPNRKRDLVGPGGAVLRQLEDRYGVSLDLTQEGQCLLFGADRNMVAEAKRAVMDLVADVVEGEVYSGTVIEIKDFGAILELLRNKEGLLHVDELTHRDTSRDTSPRNHPEGLSGFVQKYLRVGQTIDVLCIGVDPVQGSIKLSRKALIERKEQQQKQGGST